ncbi:MAG: hypothetical protein EXS09_03610 [Gemmataceae bacterium]|nr:hypothetical protein [Gemmataceae bacterium]
MSGQDYIPLLVHDCQDHLVPVRRFENGIEVDRCSTENGFWLVT